MTDINGRYKIYTYEGKFSNIRYFLKTILFSIFLASLIALGDVCLIVWHLNFMLPLSFGIFVILLVTYIIYNNQFIKSSSSALVKDGDDLWFITFSYPREKEVYESTIYLPYQEAAMKIAKDKDYILNFINDVKAGKYTFNALKGGHKYVILYDYKVVKETKHFYYVDAITEVYLKGPKRKVIKIEKAFSNMEEIFSEKKPYEPGSPY